MSKILAEISAGEFLDKLSILEIKLNKIKDLILFVKIKTKDIQTWIKKNIRSTKLITNIILQKIFV